MKSPRKLPVAVLGATGSVGQRFLALLDRHPWFDVVALTGSATRVGRTCGEAVRWTLDGSRPERFDTLPLEPSDRPKEVAIAFSALPAEAAHDIEPLWAKAGAVVCSNASAFRMEQDVPLLVPEINPEHLGLIATQRRRRGWGGAIVTNPNCSATGIALALKPLRGKFGLRRVFVATLQAASGAGYPGVPSLDLIDNVIPFIAGEESKVESEPRKLLGAFRGERIEPAALAIAAHCTRVPVTDGHTALLSVELESSPKVEELEAALREFRGPATVRDLPSAPPRPLEVVRGEDRPQPRRDRALGGGMTVAVGRIRSCPLLDYRLAVLSHNTIRGAAGGAILNAELVVASGLL